ncbi:MAG: hypothetical protein COA41_04875 [Sphingopyxis sp.]|nr:MAG: hypothetical protein COA41_04875 [Sphingopyxis sp.]
MDNIMDNPGKVMIAAALVAGLTGPALAQNRTTIPDFSFSEGVKRGDCKIAFRSRDGETMVDFGLGIMDSIFSVEVLRSGWDIVDDKDTNITDMPLTLTFQNGQTTSSEFGGYRNGFYQGVWAMWHGKDSDPSQSQRGLERLMEASSATVSFDNKTIAEVNLGPSGFAANKLLDCAIAERKERENPSN